MRLILVRHGETEANLSGMNQGHGHGVLSARGQEQAQKLASRLKNEHIDAIYCSDLQRAKDTLAPLLEHVPVPVQYTPELRDINMGVFEGTAWGSKTAHCKEHGLDLWSFKPEGGESSEEVKGRVIRFLEGVMAKHQEHTVLVISHADTISHIHAYLKKTAERDFFIHKPGNAAVSIIDLGAEARYVVFNCTRHLEGS